MTDPPLRNRVYGESVDGSGVAYNGKVVAGAFCPETGGTPLAFGATCSYHRMAVAVEDAGRNRQYSLDVWLPHRRRRRPHPDYWKRGIDITTGRHHRTVTPPTALSPSPPVPTPTVHSEQISLCPFHSTDTDQPSPQPPRLPQSKAHLLHRGTAYHEWSEMALAKEAR